MFYPFKLFTWNATARNPQKSPPFKVTNSRLFLSIRHCHRPGKQKGQKPTTLRKSEKENRGIDNDNRHQWKPHYKGTFMQKRVAPM